MARTIFITTGLLSATGLLLVDSAVKGTALLLLATLVVLLLQRDSAAVRNLVWLVAMVALLFVPLLSGTLPGWRVLPQWVAIQEAEISPQPTVAIFSPIESDANRPVELPPLPAPIVSKPPAPRANDAASAAPEPPHTTLATRPAMPDPPPSNRGWIRILPLVWGLGFFVLILRLAAARWMLRNAQRQATIVASSRQPAGATLEPFAAALQSACAQLGVHRPVALVIHPVKTIPVVWGVFRSCVLLPAGARNWSGEQLRSVLLHELAHIKRLDPLAQIVAQLACAVHWFNPLVWFAAWRLDVERERACDDLVLASGVRPSAYAGHLLEIVSGHAPARWTGCGLAMARRSSLEGRLAAVLGKNRSRRGVSWGRTAASLAIAIGVAVPIAMLQAASPQARSDAPPSQEKSPDKDAPKVESSQDQTEKPPGAARLKPATEQILKWGEPSGGLRMALAWPPSLGESALGDATEFYLVVQNVSEAPIRLAIDDEHPNPRRLMMRKNGQPISAIRHEVPTPGNWLLGPRDVAFLRMFQVDAKAKDGFDEKGAREVSVAKEKAVRVYPQYSLTADMTIEKASPGAWTGKLTTGQSRGSLDVVAPKHKEAQALYASWTTAARADGKIPGGVIGLLGESVTTFINYNPTWETTPRLKTMLPRFDASRDWSAPDAVALLDELAAVQSSPISMALEREGTNVIRTGMPLPKELSAAPWGDALPNGLRLAYLLQPRAVEYPLNTPLKGRILIHNAGKQPVVFRAWTWFQASHKAPFNIVSLEWLTLGRLVPFRLAPGEFAEVRTTGVGVGPKNGAEDWQDARVGSWIEVKAGDEVTLSTDPIPLADANERTDGEPRWWLDHIKGRLARHLPFPDDAEARKLLLYRVAMELFGTPVSDEINAAFVADRGPAALDALAKRLYDRPGQHAWAGSLTSAPSKFGVLPADPDAAKRPRVAKEPGSYRLGDLVRLDVSRHADEFRIMNDASIEFYSADPNKPMPREPYKIELADGYSTWAAAWMKDATTIWIAQKGLVRSIDFAKLEMVRETQYEGDKIASAPIPADIREALRTVLAGPDSGQEQRPIAPPAASAPPKGRF